MSNDSEETEQPIDRSGDGDAYESLAGDARGTDSTKEWAPASEAATLAPINSNFKVLGELDAPTGVGVLGQNNAATGSAYGVQAETESRGGVGTFSRARYTGASTGLARPAGLEGISRADGDAANGNAPVGVRGRTTGVGVTGGVLGQAESRQGWGVLGDASDGNVADLLPLLDSNAYTGGVLGFTDRTSADTGVNNAFGVIGIAADPDNTTGVNVGVYGRTRAGGGYGMYSDDRIFARADAADVNYAAKFVDWSGGGDSQAVLDLAIRDGSPDTTDNFIRFLAGSSEDTESALGAIESNSTGDGVQFGSASADIAEYFPKADPDERFEPGTIVGITGGEVTRETAGTDAVAVVSEAPMISGNVPYDADEDAYARIALLGQVEVTVGTTTAAGDLLVAADAETGTAVPHADHDGVAPPVVGIALADGEAGERVPTLVGGHGTAHADRRGRDAATEEVEQLRETVERQAETIERLEERLEALEVSGATRRATGDD